MPTYLRDIDSMSEFNTDFDLDSTIAQLGKSPQNKYKLQHVQHDDGSYEYFTVLDDEQETMDNQYLDNFENEDYEYPAEHFEDGEEENFEDYEYFEDGEEVEHFEGGEEEYPIENFADYQSEEHFEGDEEEHFENAEEEQFENAEEEQFADYEQESNIVSPFYLKDNISVFYVGSITVVGLFILFRILQKSK